MRSEPSSRIIWGKTWRKLILSRRFMSCRIRPFREKHYWFLTNLDFTPEVPAFNSRLKNVTLLTLGRRFPHISLISASSRPPMWRHIHRSGRKKTPLKVVFFVLVMKKGFYPLIYLVTRHHLKKTYILDLSSPLSSHVLYDLLPCFTDWFTRFPNFRSLRKKMEFNLSRGFFLWYYCLSYHYTSSSGSIYL